MHAKRNFKREIEKLHKSGKYFKPDSGSDFLHTERDLHDASNAELTNATLRIKPREHKEENLQQKLEFLKKLRDLINQEATGFDLAYEVEKNQQVKVLIYDGILFYNTFIEIGTKKFVDVPDQIKTDYKSFRTVEDTEKYIFIVWLNDTIASLEQKINPRAEYLEYVKAKKIEEEQKAREKLRAQLTHCHNCGAKILSKEQEFCEKCGVNIIEGIKFKI